MNTLLMLYLVSVTLAAIACAALLIDAHIHERNLKYEDLVIAFFVTATPVLNAVFFLLTVIKFAVFHNKPLIDRTKKSLSRPLFPPK